MHHLIAKMTGEQKFKDIAVGQKVRIAQKIVESGKERIQNFEGAVISMHRTGKSMDGSFTVRAVIDGVGVEKVFPFHSAGIDNIKILGQSPATRSKLYYLRDRSGKSARLGFTEVLFSETPAVVAEEPVSEVVVEEQPAEEIKSEEVPASEDKSAE